MQEGFDECERTRKFWRMIISKVILKKILNGHHSVILDSLIVILPKKQNIYFTF